MKKLIAVGVIGNWTGPWHSAQGYEQSAIAGPLAEGEKIMMEVETELNTVQRYDLSLGRFFFQSAEHWKRYRVIKSCAGAAAPVPTTVEVTSANEAQRKAGNAHDCERRDG